ncbi:Hint domain-containing protein [Actinoplanes sp. NBRC 101535]|uniref:Hint domain-containing protein n=1 Tax=Actinoplanes sp. NBRC 101535 TaxID=3032196 RepID=UPI0025542945|nr:Hint domain-containing protein [Actinoplanes sp. NBRC 101535]
MVDNVGTISDVAGAVAMVAAVLPPPAQVVAAAAGAVAAVAGAIDTAKSCVGGDTMGCAMGVAGMIPGVRQAKTAARGAGAVKDVAKKADGPGPAAIGGDCNSFVPGTPVLMADGTSKPIEEVELDDQVAAADPVTGESGSRPVTALIRGSGVKHPVEIDVDLDGDDRSDGDLTATDGHPFWVENERAWLTAEHLKPGQQLLTPDGARATVLAVAAYDAIATVYNLTVDDIHTYYVGTPGGYLLVHNSGGFIRIEGAEGFCEVDAVAKALAEEHENLSNSKRPGMAEALEVTLPGGGTKIYKSTSIKGKKPVLHKSVQRILNFIPKRHRSNGHGSCGLPVCLTEALNDKVDVERFQGCGIHDRSPPQANTPTPVGRLHQLCRPDTVVRIVMGSPGGEG